MLLTIHDFAKTHVQEFSAQTQGGQNVAAVNNVSTVQRVFPFYWPSQNITPISMH